MGTSEIAANHRISPHRCKTSRTYMHINPVWFCCRCLEVSCAGTNGLRLTTGLARVLPQRNNAVVTELAKSTRGVLHIFAFLTWWWWSRWFLLLFNHMLWLGCSNVTKQSKFALPSSVAKIWNDATRVVVCTFMCVASAWGQRILCVQREKQPWRAGEQQATKMFYLQVINWLCFIHHLRPWWWCICKPWRVVVVQ